MQPPLGLNPPHPHPPRLARGSGRCCRRIGVPLHAVPPQEGPGAVGRPSGPGVGCQPRTCPRWGCIPFRQLRPGRCGGWNARAAGGTGRGAPRGGGGQQLPHSSSPFPSISPFPPSSTAPSPSSSPFTSPTPYPSSSPISSTNSTFILTPPIIPFQVPVPVLPPSSASTS